MIYKLANTMNNTILYVAAITFIISISADFSFAQTQNIDKQEQKARRELLMSLQNEKQINVIIYFSQANIHGKTEADFVYLEDLNSLYDWTNLWEFEYKPNLIHDFMVAFTSQMLYNGYKVKFRNLIETKYQIRIVLEFISLEGNTKMQVFIEDTDQRSVLLEFNIFGQGDFWGSKIDMMGDGFKKAGKDLAEHMSYIFKKGKVKTFNEMPY